jgi:membrane protease YdiL (CAAX protease family)
MRTCRRIVTKRPVLAYFALAYALSWAWYVPLALRGDHVRTGVGWPTHLPGLLGPAVAAVIVTAILDGRPGLEDLWSRVTRWRIGWTWWLLVAGTLALTLLGVLVPLLTGGDVPTLGAFTSYTGIGAITPLGVVAVALVVNGLGEETGWRGFAADRLLRTHSLGRTALLVAIGWAGWHLPLFWIVDGFRSMGVLAVGWFVGLVAGSVVLTYLYRGGRHSILLAAAWHTAYNLTSGTEAAGAVVGTAASVLVIGWACWVLAREKGE